MTGRKGDRMSARITNYRPDMDDRLADLLNAGWAHLRALPLLHPRDAKWPISDDESLAQWREQGRLSEAGTFVAEGADGSLAAVASAGAGNGDQGSLHFFCMRPGDASGDCAARTLAAAENYLRACGMSCAVTEPIDSRARQLGEFFLSQSYYDADPEGQSMTMVLLPEGHQVREVALPDPSYRMLTWRDEYLDEWLRIRNAVFGGAISREGFAQAFRSSGSFDPAGWFFVQHGKKFVGITSALVAHEADGKVRGGYLTAVAVLDECRGKGLGRALVVAGLNYLIERDIEHIALNTEPFRKAAVALYENLGFRFACLNIRYTKQL